MSYKIKFILVVEKTGQDELRIVEVRMQEMIYQFLLVRDHSEAVEICHTFKPDLFLIGDQLSTISGTDLRDQLYIMREISNVPVVLVRNDLLQYVIKRAIIRHQIIDNNELFDLDIFLVTMNQIIAGGSEELTLKKWLC